MASLRIMAKVIFVISFRDKFRARVIIIARAMYRAKLRVRVNLRANTRADISLELGCRLW
jgi:hypothetical protein